MAALSPGAWIALGVGLLLAVVVVIAIWNYPDDNSF